MAGQKQCSLFRVLSLFQKCLGGSEAAMVLVGMSEIKAHVQRSSVLEDSLRGKREKAPSPVPCPKTAAAALPHYVRTTQFLGRGSTFYLSPESQESEESEAAGELLVSHIRVKGARGFTAFFLRYGLTLLQTELPLYH